MESYKPLLKLAREAIKCSLSKEELKISDKIKEDFAEEKASFVTLTDSSSGRLRGCIGSLVPEKGNPLWKDIVRNAKNSAFNDPRFKPISSEEELRNIKIEISVLSKPKKLEFSSAQDILEKINNKMGLIIKKGPNQGTFLPQVWEQIPNKEEFIQNLFLKAGLNPKDWKNNLKDIEIWHYYVDKIKE